MTRSDWFPYVAPMAAFALLTSLESPLGLALYPFVYATKALLVLATLLYCHRFWKQELIWDSKAVALPSQATGNRPIEYARQLAA